MNHQLLLFDYYQKKWIPQGFHLPKDRQWQSSFCVSNTDIFMMHGFIDAHPLTSYYAQAFQFNFISHNMTEIPKTKLHMLKSDCDTSTLAYNNNIYFFATNYNIIIKPFKNTIDRFYCYRYDLFTGGCHSMKRMYTERKQFASVGHNNQLFVFGGMGADMLSSSESYDIATDTWKILADMPSPRCESQAIVLNYQTIAILGGELVSQDDEWIPARDVLLYNIDTNTFLVADWKLPVEAAVQHYASAHMIPEFQQLVFIQYNCETWILDIPTKTCTHIADPMKYENGATICCY